MKTDKKKVSVPDQRRDFIKTAAKLTGVLALLGISNEGSSTIVSAQEERNKVATLSSREKAISLLFTEAMNTGDMKSAIANHQNVTKLTDEQISGLLSITRAELSVLKNVREKLIPLKLPAVALSMAPAMRRDQ